MILRTERLQLRDFADTDEESVHAFAGDPIVSRYTEWGPNSVEDSRAFVRDCVAQAGSPTRSAFNLAAVTADTGRLIGSVAVWVENATHHRGEIGFVFHPDVWGQGYATEAATALIRFGFGHLGLQRIAATCHPDNIGSARTLEKAGLRLEGRLRHHMFVRGTWRDSLLYAVLATDASTEQPEARSGDTKNG